MSYLQGSNSGYGRSKRSNYLDSLFERGQFSLKNHNSAYNPHMDDFDPSELKYQFSRVCDDFLQPPAQSQVSSSLGFCRKMVYELNPFFRENRQSNNTHVVRFPDDEMNRTVVLLPYKSRVAYSKLGTVVEKEGELTLRITLAQGMFLAMTTLRGIIEMYPENIILAPAARAAFVGTDKLPNLAQELNMSLAQVVKVLNFSCVSRTGHHLEESDASCALVAALHSTKDLFEPQRRLAVIAWLLKPYLNRGANPLLEKARIFDKYATSD